MNTNPICLLIVSHLTIPSLEQLDGTIILHCRLIYLTKYEKQCNADKKIHICIKKLGIYARHLVCCSVKRWEQKYLNTNGVLTLDFKFLSTLLCKGYKKLLYLIKINFTLYPAQHGRQREPSVKTIRFPLSAESWRHCVLNGGTQRRALP